MSAHILLIDDDKNLRRVTEYNLSQAGFYVSVAASGNDGLKAFKEQTPDLVVSDVKLGDMSGLELLEQFKKTDADIPVIIMTAFGSIEMAVQAMSKGAFHFITKPFDRETLIASCNKALELKDLRYRTRLQEREIDRLTGTQGIVSASSVMRDLLKIAGRAAESEATVLISGESGTGKEVLARLIHQNSPRKNGPMVAVNCAAIPATLLESELFGHVKGSFTGAVKDRKGHFELASGGTLFLDEIGELATDIQVKLLRAIQEKEVQPVGAEKTRSVDIRIIAATNLDLEQRIEKGEFREDLYYRLSVIPLFIPPLRERTDDIPALAHHFLKKIDAPNHVRFTKEAIGVMSQYRWPGNIREMRNIIERCVILRKNDLIDADDLDVLKSPPTSDRVLDPLIPEEGISLESVEKAYIVKALEQADQNRSQAARLLKIPRHVLLYRIEKYEL